MYLCSQLFVFERVHVGHGRYLLWRAVLAVLVGYQVQLALQQRPHLGPGEHGVAGACHVTQVVLQDGGDVRLTGRFEPCTVRQGRYMEMLNGSTLTLGSSYTHTANDDRYGPGDVGKGINTKGVHV